MQKRVERTTRQRNQWIDSQVKAGRPVAEVAKEANLTETKVREVVDGIKHGRLGPGRPLKPIGPGKPTWESVLGGKFRQARNNSGLTMKELIERTKERGINADLISRFERGDKQPSMKQLQDMCRVLGITISDIWPTEKHRSQQTEMRRAGHLRPNEVVDLQALLGRTDRDRNERQ